jgi:hypothetical protein
MKKLLFVALALAPGLTATAQAQESPFSATLGVRAWYTQWDTFTYSDDGLVLQSPAGTEFVLIPVLSMRYGDFVGSLSVFPSTDYSFVTGSTNRRKEFDINVGYYVTPGVALTLGYKKIEQGDANGNRYRLNGPVLGVNATAPLGDNFALYGAFALGRMKTPSGDEIQFDADYRLGEVGLAYTLATPSVAKALTFTGGYRTQVISSKEAAQGQDGRDLTQGLTVGMLVTF